jgi:hypothetical protein
MAFNPLDEEWPKKAADTVDRAVQFARRKVTTPLVRVTNAIVYSLLVACAALVIAVLGVIVLVRGLEAYLEWSPGTLGGWIVGVLALLGIVIGLVGVVRRKKAWRIAAVVLVAVFGARWALHAGNAEIDHGRAVWITDVFIGGLFLFAGAFFMGRRHAPSES